jgi:nucleoid-associated protein YgaU
MSKDAFEGQNKNDARPAHDKQSQDKPETHDKPHRHHKSKSNAKKIVVLGVTVLVAASGAFAFWKLKFSHPREQAAADAKDKQKLDGLFDPGMADAKGKTPTADHSPKKDHSRDLFDGVSEYRRHKPEPAEAKAISPPPLNIPDPPVADSADAKDRYASSDRSQESTANPPEPPGEAAAAVSDSRYGNLYGNRSPDDYRMRDKPLLGRGDANTPDAVEPAPQPSQYRKHNPENRNAQTPPSDRGNSRGDYAPYDRGPSASYASRERSRPSYNNNYDRSIEPSVPRNGMRADGTYDVQANDSFWEISKQFYGTGAYYQALEQLNRDKLVDGQLKVGQNILVPDVRELEKRYPKLCPKENHSEVLQEKNASLVSDHSPRGTRSYTVMEGDTLFDIARYELGKASRWAEIYDFNRKTLGKDFDYLIPGTELILPEDNPTTPADPVTRRPGEYQRYK